MEVFSLEGLFTVQNLLALLTLSALEIVLGIDNIVFLAIVSGKLPPGEQRKARQVGLLLAMGMRIVLLLTLTWIMGLTATAFTIPLPNLLPPAAAGEPSTQPAGAFFYQDFSWKDLILIGGGLFLLAKATWEIHQNMEGGHGRGHAGVKAVSSFALVLTQIVMIDIIFSLDSVITAVGMAQDIRVMVLAVVIAVVVMMIFAGPVSAFVERHPTIKMLALSFLVLIGVMLMVDGFGAHISKGYVYFAMGFSLFVELLNIRARRKAMAHAPPRV